MAVKCVGFTGLGVKNGVIVKKKTHEGIVF